MKKSFRTKLFVSFLTVSLFTLLVTGVLLINAVREKMEYDYVRDSMRQLKDCAVKLEGYLLETEGIIDAVLEDARIADSLNEKDSWIIKKAYNRLYALTEGKRNGVVFRVYDETGRCVLSTAEADPMEDSPVYWGIIKVASAHPDRVILHNGSGEVNHENAAICLGRSILRNDERIGYVVADISRESMRELFDGILSTGNEVVLLDEFLEQIYATDDEDLLGLTRRLRQQRFYGLKDTEDGDVTYYTYEMPERNLLLATGRQDVFPESLRRTMVIVLFVVALGVFLLSFAVGRILSHQLMSPLKSMTEAMEKVRKGDLGIQMNSDRVDEFGQLSRDFDDMTRALKVYVELRSKQQQELSDSNIAMMQAQLNPHFLYNTLDSIKWIAKANHIPELAVMSSSLARILRASISADIFVPLSKEMQLIEAYIEIQKIRFSEKFSFDAEVPTELEDAIIPKLILQPIVENAIVHGLKDRDEGYIFLNAYASGKKLVIDIEDNGCGMDEEMLKTLNERDREKLKDHIGFYNVDTIIRLHYGLNYGLQARNLKEGGVRITMELPLLYEEEKDAQDHSDR